MNHDETPVADLPGLLKLAYYFGATIRWSFLVPVGALLLAIALYIGSTAGIAAVRGIGALLNL